MKKTIISLSLVTCMLLNLGIYNLGMINNMKDNHKSDISIILSLKNDVLSILGMKGYPGETEPK